MKEVTFTRHGITYKDSAISESKKIYALFAKHALNFPTGFRQGSRFYQSCQNQMEVFLRYTWCCIIFSSLSVALSGQSLGRQLIGPAGGAARIGDLQLTWSLGEAAIAHRNAASGEWRLTEGFQQPDLMPLNGGADPTLVQVAPNPVRNMLNLYIPGDAEGEWIMTLGDVNGKILLRRTGLTAGNSEVDLTRLPSGVYFLTIFHDATGEIRQTLKVVKL